MNWLRSLVPGSRKRPAAPLASAPEGEVIYAIGDIHGRADLLRDLIKRIEADAATQPHLKVRVVALGDYVDRGADSKGVIEILARLAGQGGDQMTALKGNHEEALLNFLDDPADGSAWAEHGGRETLASYGVTPPRSRGDIDAWVAARDAFAAAIPEHHLSFLKNLQLFATVGDYVFVHAGLRPGTPLEHQVERDLLWIRQEFLDAEPWNEQVVVHGHTPMAEPVERPGRIGVDTGAYATGILTALRLEGESRRYIQTGSV